ncbi:MAG: nucleoside triphosphate pyrophosphohydrolase [Candidatus Aenigmarchaeota archaeon]|nr:nucleoside triphosphate pyrophosphohydrolase [Candidatus Aenigmarchaeota archaeon]
MKEFNKLVRDRIPEIIKLNNQKPLIRIANDEEFKEALKNKLLEEAKEFVKSDTLEELADVLEVVHCLTKLYGIDFNKLENIRKKKNEERGSFNDKIILEKVIV